MRSQMLMTASALALVGGIAIASAQTQNSANHNRSQQSSPRAASAGDQDTMQLSQDQRNRIFHALGDQQKQAAPSDFDGQLGGKVPDSMHAQSVPNNLGAEVPQTKGLLFVRMPDRVLLIDPDNQAVLEIVADSSHANSGDSTQSGRQ